MDTPPEQLELMTELLEGKQPNVRVVLLAGFYSTGLRDILERERVLVISCDYRHAERPCMHFIGDIRWIIQARRWACTLQEPFLVHGIMLWC